MRVDAFPFETKNDAARVNVHDAKLVELIGDEEGPYKYVSGFAESMPVDKSAPSKSTQLVRYQIDGQTKTSNSDGGQFINTREHFPKSKRQPFACHFRDTQLVMKSVDLL
jgi:hypothetical protein